MHGVLENIVAKSAELIPFYCESSTKKNSKKKKQKTHKEWNREKKTHLSLSNCNNNSYFFQLAACILLHFAILHQTRTRIKEKRFFFSLIQFCAVFLSFIAIRFILSFSFQLWLFVSQCCWFGFNGHSRKMVQFCVVLMTK